MNDVDLLKIVDDAISNYVYDEFTAQRICNFIYRNYDGTYYINRHQLSALINRRLREMAAGGKIKIIKRKHKDLYIRIRQK